MERQGYSELGGHGSQGAHEVLGKAFSGLLHAAPGSTEGLQHIVSGTLLAKSVQTIQHTTHPLSERIRLHKGPGLLQAVQAEGDTTCGLCAEPKAAQTLSLWHTVSQCQVSAVSRSQAPCWPHSHALLAMT